MGTKGALSETMELGGRRLARTHPARLGMPPPSSNRRAMHGVTGCQVEEGAVVATLEIEWALVSSHLAHLAIAYALAAPIGWDREAHRAARVCGRSRSCPSRAVATSS